MHKKLKWMKDTLVCAVEGQLCNLHEADTKELGEAIDMIKDLEEAIYYCTITEAMNNNEQEGGYRHQQMYNENGNGNGRSYSDGWVYNQMYNEDGNGGQRYPEYPIMYQHRGPRRSSEEGYEYDTYYPDMKDPREGRSPRIRKMYLEAKEYKDKASQLRELEKYMQELTSDIVEMIQDSSSEEKQYLEKKISALASKIGQMK